ncbi:hypothetical protein GYM62_12450 [Algoriphagus sp. NBT04N3]|jgi:hypothetical protein|uniref:hypothetical protein n=1 Tax=Algoriphagus sp. NBT04N3 TaxID=2705473 RepID=UPI001C6258FF|nr:hypothetical protein [Algoriphagus sp. NBT04N3]QYH39550.1 hypothetical protein GYM62_12450 [Algoriphagus sp. NBT04N3]
MKSKLGIILISFFIGPGLLSCSSDPIEVKFKEFRGNLVLFTVENNMEQDINSISCEITYYSANRAILEIDTLQFSKSQDVTGKHIPFLKAGEETFFTYRTPEKTISAKAEVIDFN